MSCGVAFTLQRGQHAANRSPSLEKPIPERFVAYKILENVDSQKMNVTLIPRNFPLFSLGNDFLVEFVLFYDSARWWLVAVMVSPDE